MAAQTIGGGSAIRAGLATGALVWLCSLAACGGGGDQGPTAPPLSTPGPPPSATALSAPGTYRPQPCCCGFWTYTLVRGGESTSWSCWGWIEIGSQSGSALAGQLQMEKDAEDCPDLGRCANGNVMASGTIDAAGAVRLDLGGSDFLSRHVAERNGCSVAADPGALTGNLAGDTLRLSMTSQLTCEGEPSELTLRSSGTRD